METVATNPGNAETSVTPPVENNPNLDLMNRRPIIDDMLNLLNAISDSGSSCTFALNGPWGAGKTFILDMLIHDLRRWKGGTQYLVFHYNCWQYDYYEEPLVAIVSALLDSLDEQAYLLSPEVRYSIENAFNDLKSVLVDLLKDFVKTKYGFDISKAMSCGNKWWQAAKEQKEQQKAFDGQQSLKSAISKMHDCLKELTEQYTVIVVVDELDRCLPDYAIKVLERLHHLFYNVSKTVVILGIDRTQLEHSIRTIFGAEIAADKYLQKLINFELKLDDAKYESGFDKKYSSYFDLATIDTLKGALHTNEGESLREAFDQDAFLNALFDALTPREVDQIITRCKTIHNILFPGEIRDPAFLNAELALVVFRDVYGLEKNPLYYNQYDSPGFTIAREFFEKKLGRPQLPENTEKFLKSFMHYLKESWKTVNADPGKRTTTASDTFTFYPQIGIEEAFVWYMNDVFPNRVQSFYFNTPTTPTDPDNPTPAQTYRKKNLVDLKKFDDLRRIIR